MRIAYENDNGMTAEWKRELYEYGGRALFMVIAQQLTPTVISSATESDTMIGWGSWSADREPEMG